jgi:hypothetical protein
MKRVSKSETLKVIKDTDALEIIIEEIHRADTTANKQAQLSRFVSEVQKQIKQERDLKLFALKVR